VLYGKLRPYLNKVVVPHTEGVASTEFVPIVPLLDVLDPEYLGAFLRTPSFVDYASANTTGSRQPRTRLDVLWNTSIPLPPLAEQRRIVGRIEELMGRVREAGRLCQESQKDAGRLWQSVLAQTFSRPGSELPEGWRWVRLEEACEYERRTIDPSRFPHHEFLVYSIPAYDNNKQPEVLEGSAIGSAKLVIQPNVCLFSKLNPRIPRAWVIKKDTVNSENPLLASTEFMPLRPRPEMLDVDYLGMLLLTSTFLDQVRTDVRGATGSRQRLKPEIVLDAFIPLPPLAEQRRIVAELDAAREKLQALKQAQAKTGEELQRLEHSILDKAFRGEL
jgi:type I restriction enzyme S subunit